MLVFFSFSNYPSIILKIVVRKIKASIEIRYAKLENENIKLNRLSLLYLINSYYTNLANVANLAY